jgi:hypothetical protein
MSINGRKIKKYFRVIVSFCALAWTVCPSNVGLTQTLTPGPTQPLTVVSIMLDQQYLLQQTTRDEITAIEGVSVILPYDGTKMEISLPYEECIKGIVFKEIGGNGIPAEAVKAQAVAARSFLTSVQSRVLRNKGYAYDLTDSRASAGTTENCCEPPSLEKFAPYVDALTSSDTSAGDAVNETANQALYAYNRNTLQKEIALGFYVADMGTNSEDEIIYPAYPSYWDYPPYLKSRIDDGVRPYTVKAKNALGLSQDGAIRRCYNGWNYQGILNYYYAVNPPIVRAIDIYQGDPSNPNNLRYSMQWDDVKSEGAESITIDDMVVYNQPQSRNPLTIQNDSLSAGTTAVILVTTSESIDTSHDLQVVLGNGASAVTAYRGNDGGWEAVSITNPVHFPVWYGYFIVPSTPGSNSISITGQGVSLSISPAPSEQPIPGIASSVSMDSNPSTPATLNLNVGPSNWFGYEPGWDNHYSFLVGGPYVQGVTLSQGSTVFYSASWPTTQQGAPPSGPLNNPVNIPIDANYGNTVSMVLSFSESMNTSMGPTIGFLAGGPTIFPGNANGQWISDETDDNPITTWTGITQANVIPITYIGPVTLQVSGEEDTSLNLGGTEPPTSVGTNKYFQFTVAGLPYVAGVTVSQQATPYYSDNWPAYTGVGCCLGPLSIISNNPVGIGDITLDIHFSQAMNPTAVPTVNVRFGGDQEHFVNIGTWSADLQTYTVSSASSIISPQRAATPGVLWISGAMDAYKRPMNGSPVTVSHPANLQANGNNWIPQPNSGPDTLHGFQVVAFTPTFTSTPTNTPVKSTALFLTPFGYFDSPSNTGEVFPYQGEIGDFEKDGFGDIAFGGVDLTNSGQMYFLKLVNQTGTWNKTSIGLSQDSTIITWDVSPDGRGAVGGINSTGPFGKFAPPFFEAFDQNGEIVNSIEGNQSQYPYKYYCFNSLAFGSNGNLYVLFDENVGMLSILGQSNSVQSQLYTIYPSGAGGLPIPLSRHASYLSRDDQWNVSLNYEDGSTEAVTLVSDEIGLPSRNPTKSWDGFGQYSVAALFKGFMKWLEPSKAYAQESGTALQALQNNSGTGNVVAVPDGRYYQLGSDGQTVYEYDNNGSLVCQISILEGPYDDFMAQAMSYKPGGAPGGTLIFFDSSLNIRYVQIPLPPNFTPQPTWTNTLTLTVTNTFTPTASYTATPTPTSTSTNFSGYTSTYTPAPTYTQTYTPSYSPTYFLTSSPTFTPSGDNYSLWQEPTDAAGFGQRAGHAALYYNNKFWVIGGTNDNNLNDVWSSSDGMNWSQVTANTGFSSRQNFGACVFNGKMWVMGGLTNDVWFSSDGINWIEATASAPWSARTGLTCTAFNGQMWVIGGQLYKSSNYGNSLNDVWSSSDGIHWTQQSASAPFPARTNHQCIVFNNEIWVMGGSNSNGFLNDVWFSSDGINWIEATGNAAWSPRIGFIAQVDPITNQIVIGGGEINVNGSGVKSAQNDVYHSPDGVNWTASTYTAPVVFTKYLPVLPVPA